MSHGCVQRKANSGLEMGKWAKSVGMPREGNAMFGRSGEPPSKQYRGHGRDGRHREDWSEEKDGQQYHNAPMERMQRQREMGGMKVNSYERRRQARKREYVRGVHGVTRLGERNEECWHRQERNRSERKRWKMIWQWGTGAFS